MHTYSSHTHTYKHTYRHICTHTNTHTSTYAHIQAAIRRNGREGLVLPVVGQVGHLSRQSRNTSGTHTSTYTAAILTHTNTHTDTYKHIHAAKRKNGREGLVFPVVGRVGHLGR